MIKILGTLKGIVLKSKVNDDNRVVQYVDIKLELLEGQNDIHKLSDSLKEIIQLDIVNQQPHLPEVSKPYKEDDEDNG